MNRLWRRPQPRHDEDDGNLSNESFENLDLVDHADSDEEPWQLLDSDTEARLRHAISESEEELDEPMQEQTSTVQASYQSRSSSILAERSRQLGSSTQKSKMGNSMSTQPEEAVEDDDHEIGTIDRGTQSSPSLETTEIILDDVIATLVEQQLETQELKTKLEQTSNTIDNLAEQVDQMTAAAEAYQVRLDQETSLRNAFESNFTASLNAAMASISRKQSNANDFLGARISELEGELLRQQGEHQIERNSVRAAFEESLSSIGTRIDDIETDLRKQRSTSGTETASRNTVQAQILEAIDALEAQIRQVAADAVGGRENADSRLAKLESSAQTREEQLRTFEARHKKVQERLNWTDKRDKDRDHQADILMKHFEENRQCSQENKTLIEDLCKHYDAGDKDIMGMLKEVNVQLRELEAAVRNCEVRLNIRPRERDPKAMGGFSGRNDTSSDFQPAPNMLSRPLSAGKDFLKSFLPVQETSNAERWIPNDFQAGPSRMEFKAPLPIVDPRHGNKINPKLIRDMLMSINAGTQMAAPTRGVGSVATREDCGEKRGLLGCIDSTYL